MLIDDTKIRSQTQLLSFVQDFAAGMFRMSETNSFLNSIFFIPVIFLHYCNKFTNSLHNLLLSIIERFWRTLKQEYIYINPAEDGNTLYRVLKNT